MLQSLIHNFVVWPTKYNLQAKKKISEESPLTVISISFEKNPISFVSRKRLENAYVLDCEKK